MAQTRLLGACRVHALAALRHCSAPTQRGVCCSAVAAPAQTAPVAIMAPTDTGYKPSDVAHVPSAASELQGLFRAAMRAALPKLTDEPVVVPTGNPKFGDYQLNNAMRIFAHLKGQEGAPKNPSALAAAVLDKLLETLPADGIIAVERALVKEKGGKEAEKVVSPAIAGPGFINIRVSRAWTARHIQAMLRDGIETWAPRVGYQRAVVDFSSPNVAKEMHVGHLRSTVIGDSLASTLEFCGVDVLRLNHVGDWGTQFGMLIQHLDDRREGGLAGGAAEEDVKDLQALYKAAKKRFDAEPEFKARAREAVTQLQSGNELFLQAWKRICEASRREFQAIYDRLGVRLIERGESSYNPLLRPLVEELCAMGIAEDSDGAKVVWVEGEKVPLMVQKSDGGFGYGTTDMAALRQRAHDERGDWLIYVVDEGQSGHFRLVFGAGRKAGILPQEKDAPPRVDFVGFGLVLGSDGKRIRTRDEGAAVRLVELLDEAKERSREAIVAHNRENEEKGRPFVTFTPKELDEAASIMGYGAVKYADLKNNRLTNYKFNFDEMLDLAGNTAVFLLYMHARIASIDSKAVARKREDGRATLGIDELKRSATLMLAHDKEAALGLHIVRFPDALESALADLKPNVIADYAFNLAGAYNSFYAECQVVGSEEEDSRRLLCEATAVVMRACLKLLGIQPLYRI
ncbi:hypothetical protein WJX81_006549 [Elliptochloris bilobata]|uniref:arginine--tRNA ligase n=1 Tax=Elliptochloris bilobata TaxID=381761 RepID=A0AAW1SKB5_9CHLO